MDDWEAARDAKAIDYLSDLQDSSYDFMARDTWFRNGAKADLLKYRQESREFKIVGIYESSQDKNPEAEEMIGALRDIGDLLLSEGFRYEISSMRTDNIDYENVSVIEGDYRFHTDREDTVSREIEGLFGVDDIYEALKPIRCK